jgi:uncharacterized protein
LLTSEQVADFLKSNPEFFEHHVDILLELQIPHPHGGRTVSIGERQLVATREKVKLLENKLAELIQFGEENDALSEKIQRLTLRLIGCDSLDGLIDTLYLELLDQFNVPHVAVRFWRVAPHSNPLPEFKEVDLELRQFVDAMTAPYCGHHAVYETNLWFGEHAPHLKSYALVPLKREKSIGLILMASEGAERFYPEMGTLYLQRIGEVFSACIAQHLTFIPDSDQ